MDSLNDKFATRGALACAARRNALSQNLPFVGTEVLEYVEKLDES